MLRPGMIVRFPVDTDIEGEDFRDFRLGQIAQVDMDSGAARIVMRAYELSEKNGGIVAADQEVEVSLHHLKRCHLLPETTFTLHRAGSIAGRVLIACADELHDDELVEYYALIDGAVRRISEAEIALFASTRQDPSPIEQALSYELQSPAWRQPRDQVVTFTGELRSVTYGVEDLVGSRVLLLAHQAEVVARALSGPECRLMLADEVGLGKTIEAAVILKALRRRDPAMQTLIITPSSLSGQWRNELSQKFWLDFPVARAGERISLSGPGVIVSAEDLESHKSYWKGLCEQPWGLLIVDEAHHLRKSPQLYARVRELSAMSARVLILTATPIQRRAEEYLELLQLLDPRRYGAESALSFRQLIEAQVQVRGALALVRPQLNDRTFDWEEFSEDITPLLATLRGDPGLEALAAALTGQEEDPDAALETARQIAAYVSANYRIEGRMVRNRRASLSIDLPTRACDDSYSYAPGDSESALLEDLYEHAGSYLAHCGGDPLAVELARVLLHSAASSPHALLAVLRWRSAALHRGVALADNAVALLAPAAPRGEQARIKQLAESAPAGRDELTQIERLIRHAELWHDECERALGAVRRASAGQPARDRLVQALRAIHSAADARADAKLVAFATWPQTIAALEPHIRRLLGREIAARFTADMAEDELQLAADRFQSEPGCCLLLCDELGGEGRNFQIAQQIIHIDLPWTPAQIEQRIGRVDRLGRTGEVRSLPIFARDTVEHDLFRLWDDALGLFTRSLSGLEIALEDTQNQIVDALRRSIRQGLAELRAPLLAQAAELREEVERERYFEEDAIDQRRRQEFEQISKRYRDGEIVRTAVQRWTAVAGVSSYHMEGSEMTYDARRFSLNAMRNARFLPPNMEEATRRAGRQRTTQIKGTFSRDLAVRREDLVFFAPGDDPWTDAVIDNAIECDRGRCCAVGFTPQPGATTPFFELLYTLQIDPRPLYAAGLDPVYLLQAQGYLACPHKRLLVDAYTGKMIGRADPRWKIAQMPFTKSVFTHLGRRGSEKGGALAQIERLKEQYPIDIWTELVLAARDAAERFLDDDLTDYSAELADQATVEYGRRAAGWEAGLSWHTRHGLDSAAERAELADYRRAAAALTAGIRAPLRRLESICLYSPIGDDR